MNIIRLTVLALAALCGLGASARSAIDIFVQAPDTLFPLFSRTARMDMADYHRYNLPTPVANALGGQSRIVESADDALLVQVGANSQVQLAVLPQGADTVVAVVETVLTPMADSGIGFYRLSDWRPVAQGNTVGMTDFITNSKSRGLDFPPMFFCQIRYLPQSGKFEFTNTTRAYYTAAEAPSGLGALADRLTARFDGRRWHITSR